EATDASEISAIVTGIAVAASGAGTAALSVAIGASIATNRIGPAYDYTSDQFVDPDTGTDAGVAVAPGALVRVALAHSAGGTPSAIYDYLGVPRNVALSTENY